MSNTKVLIVEDHVSIREMLSAYINRLPSYEVVGEASDAGAALSHLDSKQPNVAVVDLMLERGSGVELIQKLKVKQPELRVLVYSANTAPLVIQKVFQLQVDGFVEKTAAFSVFVEAIRAVSQGKVYFGPKVASAFRNFFSDRRTLTANKLTEREMDVLRLIGEGNANKEIAYHLGISTRTVEIHRARIIEKTGIHSIARLTLHAIKLGLIALPEGLHHGDS